MGRAPNILTQAVRTAFGRGRPKGDADAAATDERSKLAAAATVPDKPSPLAGRDGAADPDVFDDGIVEVLAEKVLLAWLRNRYQLLFPFALDLGRLDKGQATIVVHAMVAAAQADGTFEAKERQRIGEALSRLGTSPEIQASLDAAIREPKPLHGILAQVHDVQTSALVYAVSLMAVDQRKPVNRRYLKYLGARLQLSEELIGSLEQRFRSSG